MTTLSIGKVAAQSGVTVETIRFYEKEALLPTPTRSKSGYRQYSFDTVKRVRFIQKAKDLGFSLKEVASLLSLEENDSASAADVRIRAQSKLAEVDAKLRDLRRIQRALRTLLAQCEGHGPLSDCPIIDALHAD